MFSSVLLQSGTSASTIAIGVPNSRKLPKGTGLVNAASVLKSALDSAAFAGERGQIVEVVARNKRVLLFGLGDAKSANWLEAFAPVARRIAQLACPEVFVAGTSIDQEALGLCLGLLMWSPQQWKGSATTPKELPALKLVLRNPETESFERGRAMAESVNLSRTLSVTPPNQATPLWIADFATKMAQEVGLSCRVLSGDALHRERLVGLESVGKASENGPCLIRLEYRPKGSKQRPIVLVGKTMTYDTGGLSLKISGSMVGMKQDKDGGCGVLGAMHAIATVVKPDRPVVALLCAAENSVSSNAYRPDDILTFRNGVTVEVTNTDAEGRLVLADGLCWACELEAPIAVIDMATLTGGVVTALGKVYAGLFSNDESLNSQLNLASQKSGDKVWRLPLHSDYRELMKSPIADIVNSNPNRQAHPIQGAAFLSHFVSEGVPWAHIDIAGTHSVEKESSAFCSGPTGFGVRLLAELVRLLR